MPKHGPGRAVITQKPKNFKRAFLGIWSYLKRRKLLLMLAFVLSLANIAASLSATAYLQPLIDNFLQPVTAGLSAADRLAGLGRGAAVLLSIYLVSVVAAYFQSRIMMSLSQRTINEVRKDLFDHLQTLSVRYYDTHANGEIMSRFTNDVDTLNDALQNSLMTFFGSVITITGILGMMLYRSWPLTLLTLLMTPLMLFAAGRLMKLSSGYFSEQQKALGEVNAYIEEIITGQKVVKVFCHEGDAIEEFGRRNQALRSAATTAQGFAGMMMPMMRNINSVNYALVATIGGVLSVFGYLSVGGLVVFLQLAQQFGRPINEASNQYNSVITALAGAERIFEVLSEPPDVKSLPDSFTLECVGDREYAWKHGDLLIPVRGDVRFHHVKFGYSPDKTILKGIDLFAKPGQKIAFVGSTGAGKTTIINLLTRFYEIDDGQITVDGIPINEIDKDSLRRAMAVVLQDTHLFTGTVMENIRYGRPDATDEDVVAAAKLASAHSFISRLPEGYQTMIEGDGANLSQGQRQLLNIARATVADAPILILDEATSSVDTRTERHIETGLDRLMQNRTTFVIAHRLSTVRNSDAILVMEQGQIIERGAHEDLLKLGGRYYQLYTGAVELD
ncbi:MAG TPA: ABC transporter ATP-binding protein [Candidatus Fimivivens faecavium]|nr:ABC transporter ATP-binding protein [Candidatus Fimivivens faecavium]